MRRLFERISNLERRIGEVQLEAEFRFPPERPKPPPLPEPQFPPEYFLPENRRRFEELDPKIICDRGGNINPQSLSWDEMNEWIALTDMGFKTRCRDHPREWKTRFG